MRKKAQAFKAWPKDSHLKSSHKERHPIDWDCLSYEPCGQQRSHDNGCKGTAKARGGQMLIDS